MSQAYEAGFAAGERESYFDRREGRPKLRPPEDRIRGEYGRGYWDGYTPRSAEWRMGTRVSVRGAWWIETEREE